MNRKQKIIVSVTGIFIVLLILVGLTYAYFLTQISGNTNSKSISVTTANLKLVYGDGNGLITANKIIPGTTLTNKTFTVKNEGNQTIDNYAIYFEEIVNTLERNDDLVYTLTCSSDKKPSCNGITDETTFPNKNGTVVTNSIDVGETQSYELTVTYKEMNIDQSVDMNKTIEGKIQIYNLKDVIDIEGTVTNYANGDYVQINSEPKKSQINSDGTYKLSGIEVGTHTLKIYSSTGTQKTNSEIKIQKGEEENVNGNTITVTDNSESMTINIDATKNTTTIDYDEFKNKTLKYALMNDNRIMKNETAPIFNDVATEELGMYKAEDDYGDSWYFRGAQSNNYVKFAGFTWRIVRINGDDSVRLILDKYISNGPNGFNVEYEQNAYVGYMYGTPGSDSYDSEHEFTGNKATYNPNNSSTTTGHSTIKVEIDKFYETYLKTDYSNYLSDTMFCGDKSLASSTIGNSNTALGYGTEKTYYAATERLYYSSGETSITIAKPTLKCASGETNDYSRYTVNGETTPKGVITNGDLTYPIALLSADELVMAGAFKSKTNTNYYLYNSDISMWWTMSPFAAFKERSFEEIDSRVFDSRLDRMDDMVYLGESYVRPVINIKSNMLINSGNGTSEKPYTLKVS